jgi:rare lipoprotein A
MRSIFAAALVAGLALTNLSAPASAEWWDDVIKKSKASSVSTSAPKTVAAKPAAAKQVAAKPAAAKTVASAASSEDDGSRPQKKSASSSQTGGSLSGGEYGVASYYWQPQRLAGGGWFDPNAWTAAHKTLPLGTRVRVTRLDNGNTVDVTINDRGPYISGRIIDLSRRAAQAIDMTGQGVTKVKVNVLGR